MISIGQLPSDSIQGYFNRNRGALFVEVEDFPSGFTNDGLLSTTIGGQNYIIQDYARSDFNSTEIGMDTGTTNQLSKLSAVASHVRISTLDIKSPGGGKYSISGKVNMNYKTLRIHPGNWFAGLRSQKDTIENARILKNPFFQIADTNIVFLNCVFDEDFITPKNFNSPNNGVNDDAAIIQYSARQAAANRITLRLYGNFVVNDTILLYKNSKIAGQPGNLITYSHGNYFRYHTLSAPVDSVWVTGLNLKATGSYSTSASILQFRTETSSSRPSRFLYVTNNRIDANRLSYWPIYVHNVEDATIEGNFVENSRSTSIMVGYTKRAVVTRNIIERSGRGGISAHEYNTDFEFSYNKILGFSQWEDLTDGGIDIYGPENYRGKLFGNYIFTDTMTAQGTGQRNHIAMRIKGASDVEAYSNTIHTVGNNILYVVTQTERSGFSGQRNKFHHNNIFIDSYYRMIFNTQGNEDAAFTDNTIVFGDNATPHAEPYLFNFAGHNTSPFNFRMDCRNNTVNARGNKLYLFLNQEDVHLIDLSGTYLDSLPNPTFPNSQITAPDSVGHVKWIGGGIHNISDTGYAFRVQTKWGLFELRDVTVRRPASTNDMFITRPSNTNATIFASNNIINGVLAATYGTAYYSHLYSDANVVTMPDSLSIWYGTRSSSTQTLTLPVNRRHFLNTFRVVSNVSNSNQFINVVNATGITKIYDKQSVLYHFDGDTWRSVSVADEIFTRDLNMKVDTVRREAVNNHLVYAWNAYRNSYQYNGSSTTAIIGADIFNAQGVKNPASSAIISYPEYVEITSSSGSVGVDKINTQQNKVFTFKHEFDSDSIGRLVITMYDSARRPLGNDVTFSSDIGSFVYFPSNYGTGWRRGSSTNLDVTITLPDTCKWIRAQIVYTDQRVRLRSFHIFAKAPSSRGVQAMAGQLTAQRTVTAEPASGGTYEVGDRFYTPNSTDQYGFICDTAGTMREISTTGTVVNTTNKLTVANPSAIHIGEYIYVNGGGATRQVIGKFGDTLYVNSVMNFTYSGAITNRPAHFKQIKEGSGGGGGGSVAWSDITGKPSTFTPSSHTHPASQITNFKDSVRTAITLTTTGSSGAATFADGVLNIPQYSGGGGGEANTGSNYGVGGVGVYHDKNGTTLRFRNINAGSNKVSVTLDNTNREVDIDVNPANFTGIPQSAISSLADSLSKKADTSSLPILAEGANIRFITSGNYLTIANRDTTALFTAGGTAGTNVSSVVASETNASSYHKTGQIVFFSGRVVINLSSNSSYDFYINLPVAADLLNLFDASGVATSDVGDVGYIEADHTGNRLKIWLKNNGAEGITTRYVSFNGHYRLQ